MQNITDNYLLSHQWGLR